MSSAPVSSILTHQGAKHELSEDHVFWRSAVCGGGCNRTIGRVRAIKFPKLSLRRRSAIHCRIFPVRFTSPSAARRQSADADQAAGAVGFALSGKGRDAADHESRAYHTQARQKAGHDVRADMKKGRNDFVPTPF